MKNIADNEFSDFAGEIRIRISDSVLDEADWPVRTLTFVDGRVRITEDVPPDSGIRDMVGWTLHQVAAWTHYDATGQHPETYHEVELLHWKHPEHAWLDYLDASQIAQHGVKRPGDRTQTTHELKCLVPFFQDILDGVKRFELRRADRDFQVGDTLHLREWCQNLEEGGGYFYTGRDCMAVVTYIMRGPAFGLEAGWVCMSLGTVLECPREVVKDEGDGNDQG